MLLAFRQAGLSTLAALTNPHQHCRMWPLEEMAAAHEYCEQGHVRGKVGILIKQMEGGQ